MNGFQASLLLAALLGSLLAGFLFAFAVVVMPGIRELGDREFLRAFQVIDRVIQNNQPLFMLVWLGAAASLIGAAGLGVWQAQGAARWVVIGGAVAHVVGIQLPTMCINIPLNNELQKIEVKQLDDPGAEAARLAFEPRWNRWNIARTWVSVVISAVLILLVFFHR